MCGVVCGNVSISLIDQNGNFNWAAPLDTSTPTSFHQQYTRELSAWSTANRTAELASDIDVWNGLEEFNTYVEEDLQLQQARAEPNPRLPEVVEAMNPEEMAIIFSVWRAREERVRTATVLNSANASLARARQLIDENAPSTALAAPVVSRAQESLWSWSGLGKVSVAALTVIGVGFVRYKYFPNTNFQFIIDQWDNIPFFIKRAYERKDNFIYFNAKDCISPNNLLNYLFNKGYVTDNFPFMQYFTTVGVLTEEQEGILISLSLSDILEMLTTNKTIENGGKYINHVWFSNSDLVDYLFARFGNR